jgi:hypothetical protein
MSRHIRQQQAADSARGAARRIINIATVLRVTVRLAVNPRVQPSELNAARCELASTPDFHALHVLGWLVAHESIIPGSSFGLEASLAGQSVGGSSIRLANGARVLASWQLPIG